MDKTSKRVKSVDKTTKVTSLPTDQQVTLSATRQVPTMADVARYANVSTMTVSRTLNNHNAVSIETRNKVLQAVKTLGYVLDQSAGSLSSKRTGFVAGLVPSIANSNFSDTARGISETLNHYGLQLLLGYTNYSDTQEEKLIESMLRRRPEGIILTADNHTDNARQMLKSAAIPIVETWDIPSLPLDRVVGFSNVDAMRLLVRTLSQKGYHRFAFIGGTTYYDTRGNHRLEGFQKELKALNLDHTRHISFGVPPISIRQGARAVSVLLEQWPDTQVVICVSDLSAYGALMECQRRGMRIPHDIAIAGFGNFEIGEQCFPAITSVDVDCYRIGQLAAENLVQSLQGQKVASFVETPFKVVLRESA